MAPSAELVIPEAPSYLPAEVAAQWRKLFATGYKESLDRKGIKIAPDREADLDARHAGYEAANRLVRVPRPESYEEANALPEWQLLPGTRKVVPANVSGRTDELVGVTVDGQKFRFPVPKAK